MAKSTHLAVGMCTLLFTVPAVPAAALPPPAGGMPGPADERSILSEQPALDPFALRALQTEVERPEPGIPFALHLVQTGPGGEPPAALPWAMRSAAWFFIRTGATQANFDDVPIGPDGAAPIAIPVPGVALIGVDFDPQVIETPASALAAIAERNATPSRTSAGAALRALGDRPVRVRLVESAALLIRAGAPEEERATSAAGLKAGLAVEVRPLVDPVASAIDGDLFVRLYAGGGSLPGGRLRAISVDGGEVHDITVDEHGIGHFPFRHPGLWRLEVRHIARAPEVEDGEPADWVLYTGTLTFRAREAVEREEGERP